MTPFFLWSCFCAHPTNTKPTSQNIGGTDAWAFPTSNFRGSPQFLLGLRPWGVNLKRVSLIFGVLLCTYIHIYVITYIHTYIHIDVHTYISTYRPTIHI